MTWFLASNFQLCLIAPSLVFSLCKYPKFGVRLAKMIVMSSVLLAISPFFMFGINTYYELTRVPSLRGLTYSVFSYHMNTLQYLCSFTIGIFAGYAIRGDLKLTFILMNERVLYRTLTTLSLIALPAVMLWNNTLNLYNDSPSQLNALMFFGIGKLVWSASLAWIWYVCCTGSAGKPSIPLKKGITM